MWRGLFAILIGLFLAGTVEAQRFKNRKPTTSPTKAKATVKKKPKATSPPKRTRTVKKKPRVQREEPRRPMP